MDKKSAVIEAIDKSCASDSLKDAMRSTFVILHEAAGGEEYIPVEDVPHWMAERFANGTFIDNLGYDPEKTLEELKSIDKFMTENGFANLVPAGESNEYFDGTDALGNKVDDLTPREDRCVEKMFAVKGPWTPLTETYKSEIEDAFYKEPEPVSNEQFEEITAFPTWAVLLLEGGSDRENRQIISRWVADYGLASVKADLEALDKFMTDNGFCGINLGNGEEYTATHSAFGPNFQNCEDVVGVKGRWSSIVDRYKDVLVEQA